MTRTSDQSELLQVSNLRDFFRHSVGDAMESNQLSADHQTSCYVVNLLTLFARAEAFHGAADSPDGRKPLALMLADALDASTPEQRCASLQKLGDVALFMSGFFADDLQDSVVDLDYYVSMGGGAYSSLSSEARGTMRGRALGRVFAELGEKFQAFVDVLNDVRAQASAASDADTLRQYEVWLKTRSNRARRLLEQQGIHMLCPANETRQH